MKVGDSFDRLLDSSEFKEWKKKHDDSYLAFAFVMRDEKTDTDWQFGFYSKKKDKVVAFVVGNNIEVCPEEEVFKKEKTEVKEISLDNVKDFEDALNTAKEYQDQYYNCDPPSKTISILQKLDNNVVWNITFLTTTFKTLNIRIDAESGKIIKHELVSLFDYKK